MTVNIVMLAKDRTVLTRQALIALGQNTPRELFNLTIIDDMSTNRVSDFHDLRGLPVTVVRIDQSKGITGQARNLGVYWSEKYWGRGDYLYLTDNDMYFTPGWLDSLIETATIFNGTNVQIIGGWNHPFLQPSVASIAMGNGMCLKSHDAVAGASQLMRWETWDKYGPLDAHAKGVGQSEDWKFCQDIIKDGGRVGSVYPRVVFNCGITNSLGERSPGAEQMIAELQEAKKTYPDLYWE